MSRIERTHFQNIFQGGTIDVEAAAGRGIDVAAADLDGDGAIQSPEELNRLFEELDRIDKNGSSKSFDTSNEEVAKVFHGLRALLEKPAREGRAEVGYGHPLMASDYKTLDALQEEIDVEIRRDEVVVSDRRAGLGAENSVSRSHVGEQALEDLEDADVRTRAAFVAAHPEVAWHATTLRHADTLAHVARDENGQRIEGSAIGHLTDAMIKENLATPLGSGELEGAKNMALHVGGQALLTSLYGRREADYVGDTHERDDPSLFTEPASRERELQVIDNYADMVNNFYGQDLGERLGSELGVGNWTVWTPELTANYLNGVQDYLAASKGWEFRDFEADDPRVIAFARAINDTQWGPAARAFDR